MERLSAILTLAFLTACSPSVVVQPKPKEDLQEERQRALKKTLDNSQEDGLGADWVTLQESDPLQASFQSIRTASIVSLNKGCHPGVPQSSLEEFKRRIMAPIRDRRVQKVRNFILEDAKAIETEFSGEVNHQKLRFIQYLLRRQDCIYEVRLLSQPQFFKTDLVAYYSIKNSLQED